MYLSIPSIILVSFMKLISSSSSRQVLTWV